MSGYNQHIGFLFLSPPLAQELENVGRPISFSDPNVLEAGEGGGGWGVSDAEERGDLFKCFSDLISQSQI